MNYNAQRYLFLDHLRGFVFLFMAFDHCLHGYAQNWGRFWFIRDYERTEIFDAFYLFDQVLIMPMLFFIIGMFVLPALKRNGWLDYVKKRFIKLVIPFVVGVPFIVPVMTYPKFSEYVDSGPSFFEFWTEIFFFDRMQAGPFWVLYCIVLFTVLLIVIDTILKGLIPACGRIFRKFLINKPVALLIGFALLSIFVFGLSDLIWGAPWWIGFAKLFHLQGAKFIMNGIYFLMGAILSQSGLLEEKDLWEKFSSKWKIWAGGTVIFGVLYVGYSLFYMNDGAYSDEIRYHFMRGGVLEDVWPVVLQEAPMVLIRTSLMGILCLFQVLTCLSIFYRFMNKPSTFWGSLALNGYGLFLTHEVIVIWLQYTLIDFSFNIFIKFIIVASIGISAGWLISDKILRKTPFVRAIFR